MDKKLIERIALEVACDVYGVSGKVDFEEMFPDKQEQKFLHAFISRIDAERWKEAACVVNVNGAGKMRISECRTGVLPIGSTKLYLSPAIPEGWALVPVNCPHCDGTGDVHSPDGEWRGECNCGAAHESAKAKFDRLMGDEKETPIERLRFFCSLAMSGQDWIDVEPFFDALTAPQPPEPCQKCADLTEELEEWRFTNKVDELGRQCDALRADVERLTKYKTDAYASLQKKNDELYALQSTIAQQAERIAELEAELMAQKEWATCYEMQSKAEIAAQSALIEKCAFALRYVRSQWDFAPNTEARYAIHEALAAIAAQKGGAR